MKMLSTLFLLACAFVVTNAQIKRTPKPKPKPKATASPSPTPTSIDSPGSTTKLPRGVLEKLAPSEKVYSENAFGDDMLQWSSVPANYFGHDFIKTYGSLAKLFQPKDEFESTDTYQKRFSEAATKPFLANLSATSRFAFSRDRLESSYDADKEVLKVEVEVRSVSVMNEKDFQSFKSVRVAPTEIKDLGKYTGQNAFGAETLISKSEMTEHVVAMTNPRDFKAFTDRSGGDRIAQLLSEGNIQVDLTLPAERAKEAKSNLAGLFIVTLANPYVGLDIDQISPKRDTPYDILVRKRYLFGKLEEIWLFNRATGEIYQKIKAVPLTSGKLRVSSSGYGTNIFLLLDKSMTDILRESGAVAVDHTKAGGIYDLIQTFLKANQNTDSKKYQPFISAVMPLIQAHTIRAISTKYGSAEVIDVKFGNYYIFGAWSDYSGTSVWDVPIAIKAEENSIYLGSSNATYK